MAGEELPGKDFLWEYNCLYREYDSIFHDVALASGLSDSAFAILYHIMELGDGCLQKDICDRLFMSKQTIHSAIQKLRDQGYLALEPGKGRNMHIRLTQTGRRIVQWCCRCGGWRRPLSGSWGTRAAGSCCALPGGMWPPTAPWPRTTSASCARIVPIDAGDFLIVRYERAQVFPGAFVSVCFSTKKDIHYGKDTAF